MQVEYVRIRDGLQRLREPRVPSEVFGAASHGCRMHPPLSGEEVREFESRHRIALPPEYRGFLIHVGNGGAGPAYGLFKLGEMDDGFGHKPWVENGGFVGILSEPFPHTGPWNDLSEEPEFDESRANDPAYEEEYYERQLADWENRVYWNTANVKGAIPICHLGCALRQWLVVTGKEAGNVWDDHRVDRNGLQPAGPGGKKRLTFLQWYQDWLEEALGKL